MRIVDLSRMVEAQDVNLASEFVASYLTTHGIDCDVYYATGDLASDVDGIGDCSCLGVSLFYADGYRYLKTLWPSLIGRTVFVGGPFAAYIRYHDDLHPSPIIVPGFGESLASSSFKLDQRRLAISDALVATASGRPYSVSYPLSYGCYWGRCKFCDTRMHNPSMLFVNPGVALKHLRHVSDRLGVPSLVRLTGEALTVRQLTDICAAFDGSGFRWMSYFRVDKAFDRVDVVRRMAGSGCLSVHVGAEIFEDETLGSLGKGYTVDRLVSMFEKLNAVGIKVKVSLISHLPETTPRVLASAVEGFSRVSHLVDHVGITQLQVYKTAGYYRDLGKYHMRQVADHGHWVEVVPTHMDPVEFNLMQTSYIESLRSLFPKLHVGEVQ